MLAPSTGSTPQVLAPSPSILASFRSVSAKIFSTSALLVFGASVSARVRSEEHTSELQSLMRISYAVFCLIKKTQHSGNPLDRKTIYTTPTYHTHVSSPSAVN